MEKCDFWTPKRSKKDRKNKDDGYDDEAEAARLAQLRRDFLEKRNKAWKDCWEQKIEKSKKEEDMKCCCAPPGVFFRRPRAQTNVWYKVEHAKNMQNVELTFLTVSTPRPKCPAVPRCKNIDERLGINKESDKKKKSNLQGVS